MTAHRRPSISTHVLDNERGEPARGVRVTLERHDGDALVHVATAETNEDGRIPDLAGGGLRAGGYRISFDVAGYFARQSDGRPEGAGRADARPEGAWEGRDASFFRRVTLDFVVADTSRHYHVPLLVTRFACSSYRGS